MAVASFTGVVVGDCAKPVLERYASKYGYTIHFITAPPIATLQQNVPEQNASIHPAWYKLLCHQIVHSDFILCWDLDLLPTADEQGMNFEASTWFAFFVPSGTPAAIIKKLRDATAAAINTPAVQERLAGTQAAQELASHRHHRDPRSDRR